MDIHLSFKIERKSIQIIFIPRLFSFGTYCFFIKRIFNTIIFFRFFSLWCIRFVIIKRIWFIVKCVRFVIFNGNQRQTDVAIADLYRTIIAMMDLMPSDALTALYTQLKGFERYAREYYLPKGKGEDDPTPSPEPQPEPDVTPVEPEA